LEPTYLPVLRVEAKLSVVDDLNVRLISYVDTRQWGMSRSLLKLARDKKFLLSLNRGRRGIRSIHRERTRT